MRPVASKRLTLLLTKDGGIMQVLRAGEHKFIVELSDDELADLLAEAIHSDIEALEVMKCILLMTFVQLCGCRYFRRVLGLRGVKGSEKYRRE